MIHKYYCAVCSARLESGSVCASETCKAKVVADLIAKNGPPQGDICANWKRSGSSRYPQWGRIDYKDLPERPDDPEGYDAWEGAYVRRSPRADSPKPWVATVQFGRPGEVGYVKSKTFYKTEKEALVETDRKYPLNRLSSSEDSEKVQRYLFKLAEFKLYPSVDQTPPEPKKTNNTQAYPPSVGHSGPPEFMYWSFVGSGPVELQRPLPAGHSDEFVRVFHASFFHAPFLDGWIAETYGGRTKSNVFPSANEAMLWANKTFWPEPEATSKQETKWGVWITPKPGNNRAARWNHSGKIEKFSTPEGAAASPLMARLENPEDAGVLALWTYQVRVYINEHTPGNLWGGTPAPETEATSMIPAALAYGGPSTQHLVRAYAFKWATPWTRVNFRDIPGAGRVCDYVREVLKGKNSLKLRVRFQPDEGAFKWQAAVRYGSSYGTPADDIYRPMDLFQRPEDAMQFLNQKAVEFA